MVGKEGMELKVSCLVGHNQVPRPLCSMRVSVGNKFQGNYFQQQAGATIDKMQRWHRAAPADELKCLELSSKAAGTDGSAFVALDFGGGTAASATL